MSNPDNQNQDSSHVNWVAPENNPDIKNSQSRLFGEKSWESRREFVLPREFFIFQFRCATKIAEKTGEPLETVIHKYTPFLRQEMWEERESYDSATFGPLPTMEKIVDNAYENYKKIVKDEPVPYHDGRRFGCFAFDYDEKSKTIFIHFSNAEFGQIGPLDKTKIEQRKIEMGDMLKSIRQDYPESKVVQGASWLYNMEAYRRLFPSEYSAGRKIDENVGSWKIGTKIWGQFLDSNYRLKQEVVDQFLSRIEEIPQGIEPDKFSGELLSALPNPPLKVHAPIDKFYQFYGV